jgi:hypothetical protein
VTLKGGLVVFFWHSLGTGVVKTTAAIPRTGLLWLDNSGQ